MQRALLFAAICFDALRPSGDHRMSCTRQLISLRSLAIDGHPSRAVAYRLRFKTPDPLLLINCTVWLAPRTTILITPEIEYSLL